MSGVTTISGGTTPLNFSSTAGGSPNAFAATYGVGKSFTGLSGSGAVSVSGAVVVKSANSTMSISGASGITDNSAGNNKFTLSTSTKFFGQSGDTVAASHGATTLYGANTGNSTFVSSGALTSIVGGNGNMLASASGASSILIGGQGASHLTVTGAGSVAVAGAKGVTFADLSHSTGPEYYFTNPGTTSGTSVVVMGSGADSFVGGGGNNFVQSGSGNDTFGFLNGHAGGTTYIYGFDANDNILFNGYNYTLSNAPTETVASGSDFITLSDNTKIVLVGVAHKIF